MRVAELVLILYIYIYIYIYSIKYFSIYIYYVVLSTQMYFYKISLLVAELVCNSFI